MSFEPEIDETLLEDELLDDECDCGEGCLCEDYDFDIDPEELEDLDEEWEEN